MNHAAIGPALGMDPRIKSVDDNRERGHRCAAMTLTTVTLGLDPRVHGRGRARCQRATSLAPRKRGEGGERSGGHGPSAGYLLVASSHSLIQAVRCLATSLLGISRVFAGAGICWNSFGRSAPISVT